MFKPKMKAACHFEEFVHFSVHVDVVEGFETFGNICCQEIPNINQLGKPYINPQMKEILRYCHYLMLTFTLQKNTILSISLTLCSKFHVYISLRV